MTIYFAATIYGAISILHYSVHLYGPKFAGLVAKTSNDQPDLYSTTSKTRQTQPWQSESRKVTARFIKAVHWMYMARRHDWPDSCLASCKGSGINIMDIHLVLPFRHSSRLYTGCGEFHMFEHLEGMYTLFWKTVKNLQNLVEIDPFLDEYHTPVNILDPLM